jgi:pimeloyl-[acyl-carrier protein] methyl ester esterase
MRVRNPHRLPAGWPHPGRGHIRVSAVADTGRALVLVHGWGFSRAVWSPVLAALGGLPALALDLPGHGDCPDGGRLADVHEAARAVLEQLPSWVREPVWAGWSLGGLVALAAAQQWRGPQRLALICATPRFAAGPGWSCALAPSALAAFADELGRDRDALERRFTALCAQGGSAPARIRRQLLGLMADHPATEAGLRAGLAALAAADLRSVWSGLDVPSWAWLAEDDRLVPGAALPASGHDTNPDLADGFSADVHGRGDARVSGRMVAQGRGPAGSGFARSFPALPGRLEPEGVAAGLLALRPDARLRVVPGGHASWLEDPEGLAAFLREVMA